MSCEFSGRCLCGAVEYACVSEPLFQANCHCDDCRRSGGGVFASLVFVSESGLTVNSGELHCFSHETDRGNTASKYFCPTCGSQLFTRNSANPGRRGIRVGTITDASWFQPRANVYAGRRLPSTPIDDEIKAFDKMPD
ncbi:MAG TPA: hypothetical protein EYQ32_06180 [Gammaproteobacteria bacterium]|nr:hypothetical protein [Gammaproteobacteria bacterium]